MSLSGGPEAVQDLDPTPHMPHSKPLVVLLVVVGRWKGDVPGARELGWLQVGRLPTYPPPAPFRVRSVSERATVGWPGHRGDELMMGASIGHRIPRARRMRTWWQLATNHHPVDV